MERSRLVDPLLADIIRAYGSLGNPDYSFVRRALAKDAYGELLVRLQSIDSVERLVDDTDPNYDLARVAVIRTRDGDVAARLSLVSRVAVLFRVVSPEGALLVDPERSALRAIERIVLECLRANGVRVLGLEELVRPIQLTVDLVPLERVCVWHAAFESRDDLPWELPGGGVAP